MLLTGTEPTHLGITLDIGSEVSASHCLMEVVGEKRKKVRTAEEERTAVYSPVSSTLIE